MRTNRLYQWMLGMSVTAILVCVLWTYCPAATHYDQPQYDTLLIHKTYPAFQISRYDDLFKEYADTLQWDWRWLAAMAYTESRFNPEIISPSGALGLMQVMPETAFSMGIDSLNCMDPRCSIVAATRLLTRLNNRFLDIPLPDRYCFVFAAYNAGYGHIMDAIRLTRKYGGNAQRWQGEVESFLRKKSDAKFYTDTLCRHGSFQALETISFVRNVTDKYKEYAALENLYESVNRPDTVFVLHN